MRQRQPHVPLRLWARSERSAAAAAAVFPDVTCDIRAAAADAALCVFCTPIGAIPDLARQIADVVPASCAITDAGSVKSSTVRDLEAIFGGRFVGSHPMAGSERSGLEAAREDLFDGAVSIITPTPDSHPQAVAAIRSLWQSVGCRLVEMSPQAHDAAIALVSHLPHAAAAALVNAIQSRDAGANSLAGGGYRDTTRVAAGPAAMWSEILLENKEALLAGLEDYVHTLAELQALLRSNDAPALTAFLARAKKVRETLS